MKALKGFRFLSFFLFSTSLWGQNSSLSFDGTNQSVSIPSTIYSNGVQNFTIECWVKPSSAAATGTAYHGFVGYQGGSSSTSSRNPSIWMNGGEIHTDMYDHVNNTRYDVLTTTLDLAAEKWFHVAFVKSGTSQFLYINGNLVNSASAPSGAKISGNYLIGAVDNFIDGDLDEVRFWSTARTQTEIREFMQRAPRLNETGLIAYYPFNEGTGSTLANVCTNTSNINGTLNNSPTWTTGSTALAGHNSMIFDGTNDFLDGSLTTTSSNAYTIEFWFSPKKLNVQQNMVYLRDDANTNTDIATGKSLNLNGFYLKVDHGFSGLGTITGSSTSSLEFNGSVDNTFNMNQTTSGTTNVLKQLVITSGGAATIAPANSVIITELLSVPYGSYNGNGNTTLRSTSTKTAIALISDDATSTGDFTVETYFPARRAFRLFSSPVNSTSSIYANWQEGGTNTAGLGTHITGNGSNGTDGTSTGNASLFTYSNTGKNWSSVTSTNNSSTDKFQLIQN